MTQATNSNLLPAHPARMYSPAGICIYCGSKENLSDEHIVPYALGGRWILPQASCAGCSAITKTFEQTCLRTILGLLRMYFGFPTRRRKERPKTLRLKVKYNLEGDWSEVDYSQKDYPFLITFPHYNLPNEISGVVADGVRNSSARTFWIRGANLGQNIQTRLEQICQQLQVAAVMPTANFHTHEFCLMLAKIAHAFAAAELGVHAFQPFVTNMILNTDTSNAARCIGGLVAAEPLSKNLHEVSFDSKVSINPEIIAVRIRLLAVFEAPTYYVAVGKRALRSHAG